VDGTTFEPIGEEAVAREVVWVGARRGLFAGSLPRPRRSDAVDFDWFRIAGVLPAAGSSGQAGDAGRTRTFTSLW
jgi:hypothetical protein